MKLEIFMMPKNPMYVRRLLPALNKLDVDVVVLKPFHYSAISNIVKLIFFRFKGYRLVHVHFLYSLPLLFIMKSFRYFCRVLGIKIIWQMHNILPQHYNHRESGKVRYKWFYENVDAIIYHSEGDKQRAKQILKINEIRDGAVVPHGNYNDAYPNNISKEMARTILEISNDKKVILCFGYIRKNRGYEYLIEATKNMNNVHVLIAGKYQFGRSVDTYEYLKLKEKEICNLKLVDKWIPDEEVQIYFNAADIVVLPYTEIYTSGVVKLAYGFKRPVVTSDIGNMQEVVNEKTGVLVPPRDSEALRKAIDSLLNMDYEAMGQYAREFSFKISNWDDIAKTMKSFYLETLKQDH